MLIFIFALVLTTSAVPSGCSTQTFNLTNTPFLMPPTLQPSFSSCSYVFNIPSGFYAVVSFTATNVTGNEIVQINDHFSDFYTYGVGLCTENCLPIGSISTWASQFEVTARTQKNTKMRLQITVTIKTLDLSVSAGTITVANNTPSSVVYFSDWKQGTTYTITSQTKSVYLATNSAYRPEDAYEKYNSVFVFDGGKSVGTLESVSQFGYFSKSNTLQLYLANGMEHIPGALLVTDYSNVKPLQSYNVKYVPVVQGSDTATMDGSITTDQEGCVTIIGAKDGSTPITVNHLSDFGSGANFTYMQGGPLSAHKNLVSPLSNSMLPKTLSGTVNTFYVFNAQDASVHFSVPNNL